MTNMTPKKDTELKSKIDAIMKEYEADYQALAEISERLYDERELLKKSYEELDKKTGLNALWSCHGLMPLRFSFKQPFVQKPTGFSNLMQNVFS